MTLMSCSRCRGGPRGEPRPRARRSARDRARRDITARRGDESYELTFRLAAGHDRVHVAQARRALEAVIRSGMH